MRPGLGIGCTRLLLDRHRQLVYIRLWQRSLRSGRVPAHSEPFMAAFSGLSPCKGVNAALCGSPCRRTASPVLPPLPPMGGGSRRQRQRRRQRQAPPCSAACSSALSCGRSVSVTASSSSGMPRGRRHRRLPACHAAYPSGGGSSSSDEPDPDSDMQRAFQLAAQRSAALEDYRLLMQVRSSGARAGRGRRMAACSRNAAGQCVGFMMAMPA